MTQVGKPYTSGPFVAEKTKLTNQAQIPLVNPLGDEFVSAKYIIIENLKAGLPMESFHNICLQMDISPADLATRTNIASRTLARRKKENRLQFHESERLYRLSRLFNQAVHVLGNLERARQWFKSPSHGLGGKSPLEYSETEVGAREVEDLLGRIEHGIF